MQAFAVWLQRFLIALLHQARRQLIAGLAASYDSGYCLHKHGHGCLRGRRDGKTMHGTKRATPAPAGYAFIACSTGVASAASFRWS